VDTVQDGRAMGTVVITFVQQERPFASATVLMHVPDPDVIRHAAPMPALDGPDDETTRVISRGPYEMGFVAGTELTADNDVGAAEQPIRVRFPGAPDDELTNQALLAFATNFQLVGVAMRPHAGLSRQQSHLRV
jgi:acyl-CoA thioesterase-2